MNEGVRQRHELSGYNFPLIDKAVGPLSLSSIINIILSGGAGSRDKEVDIPAERKGMSRA